MRHNVSSNFYSTVELLLYGYFLVLFTVMRLLINISPLKRVLLYFLTVTCIYLTLLILGNIVCNVHKQLKFLLVAIWRPTVMNLVVLLIFWPLFNSHTSPYTFSKENTKWFLFHKCIYNDKMINNKEYSHSTGIKHVSILHVWWIKHIYLL